MRQEVKGLAGGNKQKWIREHHAEIKDYFYRNGPDAAMREFNLRQETLERLLKRENYYTRINKLSENDKWVFSRSMEAYAEIKRRLAQLEERLDDAQPVIDMGKILIDSLGNIRIETRGITEGRKYLSLAEISRKSVK